MLRGVVGGLLLIFGLQWLRKAMLRASGLKALHDEDAIFASESRGRPASAGAVDPGSTGYAFTVAFKGVLLEGLEVVFIVLTFGANQHHVPLAALRPRQRSLVVAASASRSRRRWRRVPENTLKFVVGVMLTSFGMFWGGEGADAHWPGGESALIAIIPAVALFAVATVRSLRRYLDRQPRRPEADHVSRLEALLRFAWEFVIGDDWRIALAVTAALIVTLVLSNAGAAAWWLLPIVVAGILSVSVWTVARREG